MASFVTCVHVHTGSGGMGLAQMVGGCAAAVQLAKDVNAVRQGGAGGVPIDVIDIGGGLPVTWGRVNQSPSFEDYAAGIREKVPELFDASVFRRVITEMGAAMNCKFAWLGSVVEVTKPRDGGQIAMIHAGSDIFMRQCYASEMRKGHPIRCYDARGARKVQGVTSVDIAGPLCFAGDIVSPNTELPSLEVSDIVVLEEAGGNCLSMATSHCSRRRPPVYGYRMSGDDGAAADGFGVADGFTFELISAGQSYDQTLSVWN
uniref:Diaminopimelate decarboxylase n=1 Tax=Phaeomonas parva TaxID=124430 RepID=A0A7S1TVZ8_9STRA|mmetsp:Transcript_19610/g.59370  ORF Transcript_19610/g.59370 Transcript_19610/m.59370 type:complete len:260 (+) Transcript_19610:1-780(+)